LLVQHTGIQEFLKEKSTFVFTQVIFVLLFCIITASAFSQEKKTSAASPKASFTPNPRTATLLSALVPGTGQIYNRKYWKTPIVWAASYGCFYLVSTNYREYNSRRNVVIDRTINKPAVFSDAFADVSTEQLIVEEKQYRRFFEMGLAASLVVYALNVVDANVDAHLFDFDVSDDLSLHLSPGIFPGTRAARVSLCFSVKK